MQYVRNKTLTPTVQGEVLATLGLLLELGGEVRFSVLEAFVKSPQKLRTTEVLAALHLMLDLGCEISVVIDHSIPAICEVASTLSVLRLLSKCDGKEQPSLASQSNPTGCCDRGRSSGRGSRRPACGLAASGNCRFDIGC